MTKNELTKIQRGVLEAAARRNDLTAWPIRDSKLNIGSSTRVLKELLRKGLVIEKPATGKAPVWRDGEDGERLMAIITAEGLSAIGMAPVGKAGRRTPTAGKKAAGAAKQAVVAAVSPDEARRPRPDTKLATLIAMLEREGGATIPEMADATSWQHHTVRGTLAGALVKRFALTVTSEIEGRGRVYRLRP